MIRDLAPIEENCEYEYVKRVCTIRKRAWIEEIMVMKGNKRVPI